MDISKLILLAVFVASMILMSFNYNKKKKIIFFGDSITQAGIHAGGYIKLMDTILQQEGVQDKLLE